MIVALKQKLYTRRQMAIQLLSSYNWFCKALYTSSNGLRYGRLKRKEFNRVRLWRDSKNVYTASDGHTMVQLLKVHSDAG